jgi:uncharacterized protein YjcR
LDLTEREVIADGYRAGMGIRRIAEVLGRSPSTVSREIRRNSYVRFGPGEVERRSSRRYGPYAALSVPPGNADAAPNRASSPPTRPCTPTCRPA